MASVVNLTVVSENSTSASTWNDFVPASALPEQPQGLYNPDRPEEPLTLPTMHGDHSGTVELLAPAGGLDSAFAAFQYGADAVYLGLKKFSARAEAENFTLEEVDEVTAYAHALDRPRRVFVTINTLIRQDELAELIDCVAYLDALGVDAVILQDLGVYHLLRTHFPRLEMHASTQLAVHNRAGAEVMRRLGFQRVVLARELTFEEVEDITKASGVETEVFVHGALCYSYSGLCLFSSQTLGRSGNRGKCAYSCRDSYDVVGAPLELRDGSPVRRDPRQGFPFSMKDLALPDHLPALRSAGVSCVKIEGRKKSPLYVATTTNYYRKLLDNTLDPDERPVQEADLQTVFSRPWTRLFVQSHKDKEVADRDTVGHRGTPIGTVEKVVQRNRVSFVRFRTRRGLERHDGLQIDLPILGKPFGFPVDRMYLVEGKRSVDVLRAEPHQRIEVALPLEHPDIPAGATVYCSSSQDVKRRYKHARPRPELYRTRKAMALSIAVTENELKATAHVGGLEITRALAGPFSKAKDAGAMEETFRKAFGKLGDTRLELADLTMAQEGAWFVPVSRVNALRRELTAEVERALAANFRARVEEVVHAEARIPESNPRPSQPLWSLKVDRAVFADDFEPSDWSELDELIIEISRDHPSILMPRLELWSQRLGRERLRLAVPPLTRAWEEFDLRKKIALLLADGWNRWEISNLSGWSYLGQNGNASDQLDLTVDWPIYVVNRLAAKQVLALGARRFTLSPEDGLANMRGLLAEFPDQAVVIVYQDTPQFLAESCAYANLIGGCPGKANCKFESMEMVSSHGERVTAIDDHCRTIVLNDGPFALTTRLSDLASAGAARLRADFVYRPYPSEEVRRLWRLIRAGLPIPNSHAANFDRGLL